MAKILLFLFCAIVSCLANNSYDEYNENILKLSNICEGKTGVPRETFCNLFSQDLRGSNDYRDYYYCISQEGGFFDPEGYPYEHMLEAQVPTVDAFINKCRDLGGKDPKERVYNYVKCYRKTLMDIADHVKKPC